MTIKQALGIAGLVLGLSGCSDEHDALQAVQSAGWSNAQVIDSDYFLNFTCDKGEIAYRVKGTNPAGKTARATVCCGYTTVKGCTIRD